MKIELIEDVAGMKKGLQVEVDIFTGSEMIRLKHAKEVGKKEDKVPAHRETKELKTPNHTK